MRKKSTAVFTAILSATLLWGGVPAAAQPTVEPNVVVSDSNYVDSPRLQYLSSVFTDLTINGNRADCQGNFTTFKNVQVDLTVTLQRSRINTSTDSSWSDVTWWSMTWTGPCQRILPAAITIALKPRLPHAMGIRHWKRSSSIRR